VVPNVFIVEWVGPRCFRIQLSQFLIRVSESTIAPILTSRAFLPRQPRHLATRFESTSTSLLVEEEYYLEDRTRRTGLHVKFNLKRKKQRTAPSYFTFEILVPFIRIRIFDRLGCSFVWIMILGRLRALSPSLMPLTRTVSFGGLRAALASFGCWSIP
jgi:hypothetical protein